MDIAIAVVISGIIVWLIARSRHNILEQELQEANQKLTQLEAITIEKNELLIQLAVMRKEKELDAEKLTWLEKAQTELRESFQALATQVMQANSDEFRKQAQTQVEALLGQMKSDWNTQKVEVQNLVQLLGKELDSLDKHIRELEQKREGAYQGLQTQLIQLQQAHIDFQKTTTTLTEALKSSKTRGRWGELQLRRIVELAGMSQHVDFSEQVSVERGCPDMIVHLPDKGVILIDSKVPLNAFMDAIEAKDEDKRLAKLKENAKAVRNHVKELRNKKYWETIENTPDLIVMCVQSEAGLNAAFEYDGNLLDYALENQVLITTPITLLALLKAIAYGWQQHQLTENTRSILKEGHELYKRLNLFLEYLRTVGKSLEKTVDNYNNSIGFLERRLKPSLRRLRGLGLDQNEIELPSPVTTTVGKLTYKTENEPS